MKAVDLNREEMLKESRKIYRNISKRLKRIREMENVPEYALNRFRRLQENYPRDIRELNETELRKYYRELRDINNLKSSSVKGVQQFNKNFGYTDATLSSMPDSLKDKFWDIYGKIYEYNANLEKYKYEIFNTIRENMMFGGNYEGLEFKIIELYDELYKSMGDIDDAKFDIRFTAELGELSLFGL